MEILYYLDLAGTFVFAISGTLSGASKRFDLFGAAFMGFITAIGGGTIRDLLLGATPVGWMENVEYLGVIGAGIIVAILFKALVLKLRKTLFLFDTIGIGVFTIVGLQKALAFDVNPVIAVFMGMISAVFGGVLRDILGNEIPLIFRKEIYATACLAGAGLWFVFIYAGIGQDITALLTVGFIIAIRITSIKLKLSLPRLRN